MTAAADLTEIFNLIFSALKSIYHVLSEQFVLSVYGFTFSLWDFLVSLFILSALVPLVSSGVLSGGASDFISYVFQSESERIKESKELAMRREQERINAEKAAFLDAVLRSREARGNYANRRGLPNKNIVYGYGDERKKLK